MTSPVGMYEDALGGEYVAIELWKPEKFAAYYREEIPKGVVCACTILEPDVEYLVFEAAQHDSEVGMIPPWAEGERRALVLCKLLGASVLDSRDPYAFWLKDYPKHAPETLVEKLRESN